MIRRPPRSTLSSSSAASDVYKRQVSGGSEGARLGTLTMFVGGAEPDVARARPILEALGKTITHLGPLGSGQAAKAVNQVVISGIYLGVAEGIVLGLKAGLDPPVSYT